jgi:hypothetical protein
MAAPARLAVMARSPTQQAAGGLGLRLGASERSRTGRQAVAAFLVRTTSAGLSVSQPGRARALDGCLRRRHLRFRVDVGAASPILGCRPPYCALFRSIESGTSKRPSAVCCWAEACWSCRLPAQSRWLGFIGCLGERVEAAYTVPAYLGLIDPDRCPGRRGARPRPHRARPAAALRAAAVAAHRGPRRGPPLCLAVNAHIAIAAAIGVGRYRRTPSSCGQEGCCASLE